jgi:hypothetical protein
MNRMAGSRFIEVTQVCYYVKYARHKKSKSWGGDKNNYLNATKLV